MSENKAGQSISGGSGSQEAPVHRQGGAGGHAASVAQQEEDGVHHILHLCRQVQVKSRMKEASLILPTAPNPQAQASARTGGVVLVWTPA